MRELKSYRDPYTDYKRKQAIFGPYRSPRRMSTTGKLLCVAYVVVCLLFIGGAI